jgi:hypothetical protein
MAAAAELRLLPAVRRALFDLGGMPTAISPTSCSTNIS